MTDDQNAEAEAHRLERIAQGTANPEVVARRLARIAQETTSPEAVVHRLERIVHKANRLMALIHKTGICADPKQEIAYMQADLDSVRRAVSHD